MSLSCARIGSIDEWLRPSLARERAAGDRAGEVQRLQNQLRDQVGRKPGIFEGLRLRGGFADPADGGCRRRWFSSHGCACFPRGLTLGIGALTESGSRPGSARRPSRSRRGSASAYQAKRVERRRRRETPFRPRLAGRVRTAACRACAGPSPIEARRKPRDARTTSPISGMPPVAPDPRDGVVDGGVCASKSAALSR